MSAAPGIVDLSRYRPEDHLAGWEDAGTREIDGNTVLVIRCVAAGPAVAGWLGLYFWEVTEPRHTGLEAADLFGSAEDAFDDARIEIERAQDRAFDR